MEVQPPVTADTRSSTWSRYWFVLKRCFTHTEVLLFRTLQGA